MSSLPPLIGRILVASGVAVGLVSCTSGAPSEPAVSMFSAGTCRQAAPALVSVDRLVHRVRDRHTKPQRVLTAMTNEQRRLQALPVGAEPAVDALLRSLVTDIGLLRISLATDNYHRDRLDRVASAQQSTVRYCTRTKAGAGG